MSRRRPRPLLAVVIAAFVLGLFLAARSAAADDIVHLKNGAKLEGRIVEEDETTITIESRLGAGVSRIKIKRTLIDRIEKGIAPLPASGVTILRSTPAPQASLRDEWWLLTSDGKVVGTRHLLVQPMGEAAGKGVKIEEQVSLFATPRFPAVRVQRIEEVDEDWLPRHLFYRERGEAGTGRGATPAYETIRSGEVKGGVWAIAERLAGGARDTAIAVPAGAQSPLAVREALARANPRVAGLAEVALVDPARGEVRRVRAGFSSLGAKSAAGEQREDVLRLEDGDAVRESRWVPAPEVRCVREEVASGVVATPATAAQAEAARIAAEGTGERPPKAPTEGGAAERPVVKRPFTLPELGVALELPGASWEARALPLRREEDGLRAVANISSKPLVADVRIEWDPRATSLPTGPPPPAGADPAAAEAESALLVRLRGIAPDLEVVESRRAVAGVPGAFRMTVRGTVRRERLRTAVLVADRGTARVILLASCPEAAWTETRGALEAILDSFRWL